ncbi:MAG: hypothetical protein IPG56_14985 [Caulobacteraceae bacterium]|nr:hypothetical protein [Caulobacteraceae bacterium]
MIAKIAVAPPCMIAVPKPRTSQAVTLASVIVKRYQMFSITENPAPDGKARNRGVDFEAEPIAREEIDNWRRLQAFLDDRRDVAREGAKPDRKAVHHAEVGNEAEGGRGAAHTEKDCDLARADQVEGV